MDKYIKLEVIFNKLEQMLKSLQSDGSTLSVEDMQEALGYMRAIGEISSMLREECYE